VVSGWASEQTHPSARSPTGMHGQNMASGDGVTFAPLLPAAGFIQPRINALVHIRSHSGRSSLLDAAFRSPAATTDLSIRLRGWVNVPGLHLRSNSEIRRLARSVSFSRPVWVFMPFWERGRGIAGSSRVSDASFPEGKEEKGPRLGFPDSAAPARAATKPSPQCIPQGEKRAFSRKRKPSPQSPGKGQRRARNTHAQ
jgi:hypothetical protein